MSKSRKGTMRAAGHIWRRPTDMDAEWIAEFDRFICTTWQFGSIHQCKIWVKYDTTIGGKPFVAGRSTLGDNYVGMCRQGYKTRQLAMEKGVEWCEQYQKKGPLSVEKAFQQDMKHWSDLFHNNRIAWIDHQFFVIGNGADWLDGALIHTSVDSVIESRRSMRAMHRDMKKWQKEYAKINVTLEKHNIEPMEDVRATMKKEREDYWNSGAYQFYPVSEEYSAVTRVPDDVRPDWLQLSYEAALLLRDKSGIPATSRYNDDHDKKRQENNRKIGAEVVADIESRFPHVKEIQQISA